MNSTETSVSARPASQNAGSARKKPVHAASRCDAAGPDGTWEISADCRAQTDVCARVKGPRSALRSMQYSACGPSAAADKTIVFFWQRGVHRNGRIV